MDSACPAASPILVTGGTGYLGFPLVSALVARGRRVHVLCRERSTGRVAPGARPVVGDALAADSVAAALPDGATLVHLVGTPHPSPSKASEFLRVDLASIEAGVAAAVARRAAHLVYVSVAHPAPLMRAYVAAREAGEAAIEGAGLTATILRPWYVLGPGHWWPLPLVPIAWLLERIPATRDRARRLGFVTRRRMVDALVAAVLAPPPAGTRRILEVPAIRAARVPG